MSGDDPGPDLAPEPSPGAPWPPTVAAPTAARGDDESPPAGWIDWAAEAADGWRLGGWMALPRGGGFDAVRARWNGREIGPVELSDRPDLNAHLYWLREPRRLGLSVAVPEAHADGRLELVGERAGRAAAAMSMLFLAPPLERTPLPPRSLTERVSDLVGDAFRLSALRTFTDLWDQLLRLEPEPRSLRVLDWGCGCGRVARYLARAGIGQLTGCDIDGEAVRWCARHLPGEFVRSNRNPPLPFEDGSFDVVIASSVFTHLGREDQHRWLGELRRVLRLEGIVLASTAGEYAFGLGSSRLLAAAPSPGSPVARAVEVHKRRQLRRAGIIDHFTDDHLTGIAPAGYYRGVYQSRAYVERAWTDAFALVDHVERGVAGHLDLVVLAAA